MQQYKELKDNIELKLDEADKEASLSDARYSHEEVFTRVKARHSGEK